MGNMLQETISEIWTRKIISKFRKNLIKGNRCDKPCTKCNADGTLFEKNHAEKWRSYIRFNFFLKERNSERKYNLGYEFKSNRLSKGNKEKYFKLCVENRKKICEVVWICFSNYKKYLTGG